MQKTIFITGASSGLGRAAAKLFQSNGWNVIATMRSPEKEKEIIQLDNVTVLELDVTKESQIREVVNRSIAMHSVDVVLNNAGYGLVGALEALSDEQIVRQLNTNLLGVVRTTKAFLPHFRTKQSGTIINVTSMFGFTGYPTCSVYSASKFAIDGFSESLSLELAHLGVAVKIVVPGGIQTDFAGRSMDGAIHSAYQKLVDKVSEGYSEESVRKFSTPEQIAAIIYEAATDHKTQLRYIAGSDAQKLYEERLQLKPEGQYQNMVKMFC